MLEPSLAKPGIARRTDRALCPTRCAPDAGRRSKGAGSMHQREMSYVLRAIDILCLAICAAAAVGIVPRLEGSGLAPTGFVWSFAVGMLPLFAVGCVAWPVFADIGHGSSFTARNAVRLRAMGYLAAVDVLLWAVVTVAYALHAQPQSLGCIAIPIVLLVFAVGLAVVAIALSHLTAEAANIKDENDLVV